MGTNDQGIEDVPNVMLWGGRWKNAGILGLVLASAVIASHAQIIPTLTTLHEFAGAPDSVAPDAGLIQGIDDNFYGTTVAGGVFEGCTLEPNEGCGTVFKMTPSGTVTILHSFCGQGSRMCPDGFFPRGTWVLSRSGSDASSSE